MGKVCIYIQKQIYMQTYRHRQTSKQIDIQTNRCTRSQTDVNINRLKSRQIDTKNPDLQASRQTDLHAGRQTHTKRQIYKQADRHTDNRREVHAIQTPKNNAKRVKERTRKQQQETNLLVSSIQKGSSALSNLLNLFLTFP